MIVGANDIVNPSAHDDPDSPIAGMPAIGTLSAIFIYEKCCQKGVEKRLEITPCILVHPGFFSTILARLLVGRD